ncbi:MAG: hypothetical protein WD894_01390 [Pirellulales bacterium]
MKSKATSVSCKLVMAAALVVAATFGAQVASGQVTKPAAEGKVESQESANKQSLAVMRTFADTIQVTVGEGEQSKEAKLIPEPLFRFSDPSRTFSDGSVWAWTITARPVVMTEFNCGDRNKRRWGHDLVATSDVRVSAAVAGYGRWAPRESDFKLQPVPEFPPPAKTEAGRLRQMKQFARSLSGSEEWQNQRSELRLLPTEVYRYSDVESGLLDGAAFVFAVGSNPEAILFVEVHKTDSGERSWKYGLARMSAAAVTFRLGDTEVWAVPQTFGSLSTAYHAFSRAVPAARAPDVDTLKKASE